MDSFAEDATTGNSTSFSSVNPSSSAAAVFNASEDNNSGGVFYGEDSFLASLESGGTLLNTGHWSIGNSGGDSIQWSGVKAGLYDPWALSAPAALQIADNAGGSAPLNNPLFAPTKNKSAPTGFLGIVKPDPEGAWSSAPSAKTEDAFSQNVAGAISPYSPPLPTGSAGLSCGSPVVKQEESGVPNTTKGSTALKKEPSAPKIAATSAKVAAGVNSNPLKALVPKSSLTPEIEGFVLVEGSVSSLRIDLSRVPASREASASEATAAEAGRPAKARPSRGLPPRPASKSTVVPNPQPPAVKPEVCEEDEDDEDDGDEGDSEEGADGEPTSELSEKRRRNREHAKRSRMRKRVRLGGLEERVLELRRENVRLRQMVKQGIPDRADDIIRTCAKDNTNADLVAKQDVVQGMRPGMKVGGSSSWGGGHASGGTHSRSKSESGSTSSGSGGRHFHGGANRDRRVPSALKLMSPSYESVKALSASQANFILTNPNLPGCPIIFASPGFLELTGYEAGQVIGKNCRMLQGPGTDPVTVSIIRNNMAEGRDTSVCILNYKADGTPFWNQLSVGNLLDAHGQVANNVGVLCEVKQMPPADFHRLLHRVPLPESLLNDSSDSGEDIPEGTSIARSRYSAAASRITATTGGSSKSAPPRVVDRLRRTRAAAASAAE